MKYIFKQIFNSKERSKYGFPHRLVFSIDEIINFLSAKSWLLPLFGLTQRVGVALILFALLLEFENCVRLVKYVIEGLAHYKNNHGEEYCENHDVKAVQGAYQVEFSSHDRMREHDWICLKRKLVETLKPYLRLVIEGVDIKPD